jgi:CRP-like cAMP-binding protein
MLEEYFGVLLDSELFNNFSKEELSSMLGCLNPSLRKYKKEEIVAVFGEPLNVIGIVLSGEITIAKETPNGNRIIMSILSTSEMFGEIAAFSGMKIWPATVSSSLNSVVIFIPKDKIVSSCDGVCPWHRKLTDNMLKIVAQKALLLNKKVEYLSIKSMRSKLATYFYEQYKLNKSLTFQLPLNRNGLSEFLGVSRPSMSREMSRLQDEGIIDFYLNTIKILNLQAIKDIIENMS